MQAVDECLDGGCRVLTGQRLDVERGFRAACWIGAITLWPRAAAPLCFNCVRRHGVMVGPERVAVQLQSSPFPLWLVLSCSSAPSGGHGTLGRLLYANAKSVSWLGKRKEMTMSLGVRRKSPKSPLSPPPLGVTV